MTAVDLPPRRVWLRQEASDAAVRLIVLPHSGAGAASFNRWLGLFPPTIAPVRVQLPGREEAATETPLRRVRDAVDALLPQVCELVDEPRALYGHSMGALVAFELARALTSAGHPPVHLFVSGRRAPQRSPSRATIHELSDDELITALETMDGTAGVTRRSPTFLRYALPLTRADLELSEEYAFGPGPVLPCPITAFYGTEDPVVDADEVDAWRDLTAASFAIHGFSGAHFFHQRHRAAIVAIMDAALE
ncbi:MAG: thioesterase II family protein [Frankia sp.]